MEFFHTGNQCINPGNAMKFGSFLVVYYNIFQLILFKTRKQGGARKKFTKKEQPGNEHCSRQGYYRDKYPLIFIFC